MIAEIFYPILTRASPGLLGGRGAGGGDGGSHRSPWKGVLPKTEVPIFFLYYPLLQTIEQLIQYTVLETQIQSLKYTDVIRIRKKSE